MFRLRRSICYVKNVNHFRLTQDKYTKINIRPHISLPDVDEIFDDDDENNRPIKKEDLSKVEIVKGRYRSEWTPETNKSFWDVIRLITEKKVIHNVFLGIDDPTTKILHKKVDFSQFADFQSSFTWVI